MSARRAVGTRGWPWLALGGVVLALAGATLLPWDGGRDASRRARGEVEAPGPRQPLELAHADAPSTASEARAEEEDGAGSSSAERPAARAAVRGGSAPPAPPRAPIRGRLVVAETLDPIEGVFALRLRTADLELGESLVTHPNGTFASATPFPRAVVLALVEDENGRELVDQEARFDPEADEEWRIHVSENQWPTFAFGTVIDGGGAPVEEARVQLVPLDEGRPYAEAEGARRNGRIEMRGLRRGLYRLHVQGRWARSAPVDIALQSGPNDLGLLVVDPLGAGDVRVRIRSADESWPYGYVVLRARSGGRTVYAPILVAEELEDGVHEVVVPDVPAGAYTLTVEAVDGRTYRPDEVELSPPAFVELTASAPVASSWLRARDARTGDTLRHFTAWTRSFGRWRAQDTSRGHGEWLTELEVDPAVDRWIVGAEGFRPRTGSHAPDARGTRVVDLEPGWGRILYFRDVEGDQLDDPDAWLPRTGLGGVEILLDGEVVATSGADGMCVLALDEEPEALAYRLAGWRVLRDGLTAGGYRYSVLMIRSP